MPRPEILLVRHGETVWNREGRFQGQRDSPLTRRGVQQMLAAGRTLRARFGSELAQFTLIASPLARAWQSAVLLTEAAGLEPQRIQLEPLVREISWGAWDGLTAEEIAARDPELWQRRIDDAFLGRPPNGGESRLDVLARAQQWLAGLGPQARVLVVTHGTFGRALRCAWRGLPHAAMLAMRAPQDAVFRLVDDREEVIAIEGLAESNL
jgi:probable phosphoglycerate mutase